MEQITDPSTNQKKSRQARQRRLVHRLLIALVCVIAVLLALLGYAYLRTRGRRYDMTYPYRLSANLTSDNQTSGTPADSTMASPFAASLVVSDSDVELGNIRLQSSQERGLLFDLDAKEARFAKGCYDKLYPASITKIMTAILCVEHGNMDESVTMTDADVNLGSDSQVSGMQAGDTATIRQLFSALLVYSANDCAMAIARTIGDGSVDTFVSMMNEKAKSLGMTGTHFANPHGLHEEDHYTTPYDVYLMLNAASRYSEITDVMKNSIYKLTVTDSTGMQKAFNLDATDKYLSGDHALPDGVTIMAGKTGTTNQAGNCLALAVQNRYGIPYIAIIMNAPNKQILYADMDTLLSQTNAESETPTAAS
jgi:D-alanyl-D-alanine carboxypeptidase (penicillin-binding protein 5/6)